MAFLKALTVVLALAGGAHVAGYDIPTGGDVKEKVQTWKDTHGF